MRAPEHKNGSTDLPTSNSLAWHTLDVAETLAQLRTTANGLSATEATSRLAEIGPNRLPAVARRSALRRLFSQFHNVLIYVLLGAALMTALLGHWIDAAVILAVVLINAAIGYVQEGKAEQAMDAIRNLLAPRASVFRDGIRIGIDGEQLVPGDIVSIEAGDRVPADLRLIQERGLSVQESALTGESVPVEKQLDPVASDVALGERTCLAFSGTVVTAGTGVGVVIATGMATEIGRIGQLLANVATLTTPLVAQIQRFGHWLTWLILAVAVSLLIYGYYAAHYPFAELFMAVVGLSVAAIPEGLPAVLSITLAIGVRSMAARNAIVRRLPAIETIGSVSVVCTDKTGTLTRNEMLVASALTSSTACDIEGDGYAPFGAIRHRRHRDGDVRSLTELALAALLCNDAALGERDNAWVIDGDPMEGALLAFAAKVGLRLDQERRRWPRIDAIPFDARHRYMATLHEDADQNRLVFVKGAPEQILANCATQRTSGNDSAPLDQAFWHAQIDAIAAHGQRVLAFAVRRVDAARPAFERTTVENGLTLLGMVGLIDPPRLEALQAIADCLSAGISVKMITGDHAGTASAIAQQIGFARTAVLTGPKLDAMSEAALNQAVLEYDVFARTSPEHKLRLVEALQAHGLSVAMTGDGVNDAPALKRADAGIAMGKKGTEAAKEAADLVLADDNFASIVAAIREGRTVYDNIKKVISWTLPTNAGEALTVIVALLMGMSLPVTPVQILWINLITAATLGLALAFEPTEIQTMQRPPRRRDEALLGPDLVWHVVLVSLLFLGAVFGMYHHALGQGHSLELARTIALNTLVVLEIFHLFFIRNIYGTSLRWSAIRGTPVVWAVVAIVTGAQFAITYLPPLQAIFGTAAVPLNDGLLIVLVGGAFFALIELEKQVRLRWLGAFRSR